MFDILSEDEFRHNSHNDDDECGCCVFWFRGGENLLGGLNERCDACRQYDDGNNDSAEIFDASETEGVLAVGWTLGKFGTNDGNNARQSIA